MSNNSSNRSAAHVLPASTLASLISACITNPLEVLKIRQQKGSTDDCHIHRSTQKPSSHPNNSHHHPQQHHQSHSTSSSGSFKLIKHPRKLLNCSPLARLDSTLKYNYTKSCLCLDKKGLTRGMLQIWRMEGLKTFLNGLRYSIYTSTSSTVCYFYLYEKSKQFLASHVTAHSVYMPLLSAMISRTLTTSITFPLEFIRTGLHAATSTTATGSGIRSKITVRKMIGPFWSTLQRDILFSSLYWVLVENIRETVLHHQNLSWASHNSNSSSNNNNNNSKSLFSNIVAGSVAGATTAFLTLPLDVVKTKRQLHHKYLSSSSYSVLKSIIQDEGVQGLYAGSRPRIAKAIISCSAMLSLYEYFLGLSYALY